MTIEVELTDAEWEALNGVAADFGFASPAELMATLAAGFQEAEQSPDGPEAEALADWLQFRLDRATS